MVKGPKFGRSYLKLLLKVTVYEENADPVFLVAGAMFRIR